MNNQNQRPDSGYRTMDYASYNLKIDQLVGYINDDKINLIPPFQRGQVWTPVLRKRLIENIVRGKPIPAIFLYREPVGDKYEYNILDGKQRLESLMLFIGSNRPSLSIKDLNKYFFDKRTRNCADFSIEYDGK